MGLITSALNSLAPFECMICGQEGDYLCLACLPGAFDVLLEPVKKNVFAGTTYHGYAKRLVYQMKFVPDRTVCESIARWLDGVFSLIDVDVVTWAPTANQRVRERGFDQSKLIAKHFAQIRGLNSEELLYRIGKSRQVGAEKKDRQSQVKGVFVPAKPTQYTNVLLIDDIITTGSTLAEATRVLKNAGAKNVTALAFARSC